MWFLKIHNFKKIVLNFAKIFSGLFGKFSLFSQIFFLANCQTLNKFTTIAITRGGGHFADYGIYGGHIRIKKQANAENSAAD